MAGRADKMSVALKYEKSYTAEEWMSWDESVRCEIIDGKLYMMAEPTIKHQDISANLITIFRNFLKGKPCRAFHAPIGVRLNKKEQTGLESDIVIVCDKDKYKNGKIIEGAPDLVVEILSPSTIRKDRVTKYFKYLQAGVREYWIIDPIEELVQVNILENGNYIGVPYDKTDTIPVHILDGCTVDLNEVFTEEEDEAEEVE
jgi:Uma2 family endonuclease